MKTFSWIGGLLGLVLFLAIGLLPALVYGGFAGVTIAASVFGPTVVPTLFAKCIIVCMMLISLLSVAGLFTVLGAIFGAGIHTILGAIKCL